jgi:hypothetical protein
MLMCSRSFVRCLGLTACIGTGLAAESAAAPGFVCHPVRPGDSASAIALRLTQSNQGWNEPGFQIFDPIAARFIPKAHYRRIHPGWQVCVVESLFPRPLLSADALVSPNRRDMLRTVAIPTPASTGRASVPIGWWWLPLLAMTPVMAWVVFQTVVDRSDTVARTLETFAADFIREFERPLIDERTHQSALHSEISVSPRMRSMEVRLAPAGGRRYPNLEDHRSNVEYDIHRVLTLLDDRRFSCGPTRSHGPWIAFPFRLRKEGEA